MNNMEKGLVVRALASFFYVKVEGNIIECRASKKLKLKKNKIIVGDYVIIDSQTKYISEIVSRENELIRPLIANVNNSFLVFSIANPKMNYGLLDRMLLVMELNQVKPIIIITKTDLITNEQLEVEKKELEYYESIEYKIIYSQIGDGKSDIKKLLENDKYVITGQTGVGKSTLINEIIPDLNLQTQEISNALNRGKHTTREVTFYDFKGSYLIDTPGFSSLDIDFTKEQIRDNYIDFFKLSSNCKFKGCYHDKEPNCFIKTRVDEGLIPSQRYENYIKYLNLAKDKRWKK